jgi:protein-tyrosine phosphatase
MIPRVIDLHCHVLPGLDDGPRTLAGAVALARVAAAQGTRTLVATPHVTTDLPRNDSARIAAGVAELRAALAEEDVELEVLAGAEVAMDRALELGDDELRALRLGGSPWLLLECPLKDDHPPVERTVEGLLDAGHRVLLAHPERSRAVLRDPGLLERLVARAVRAQVTATALTGAFGREPRRAAHDLVARGLATVVASDAHHATARPPLLEAELRAAGLSGLADWLCHEVPAALLAGGEPPPRPAVRDTTEALGPTGR